MCAVSMIGDFYGDKWRKEPWYPSQPGPIPLPGTIPTPYIPYPPMPDISRAEFEDLKRQVLEMKELLKRAKKYDEDNGEPDCEIDDKMEILRRVAKLVNVDLNDVIAPKV